MDKNHQKSLCLSVFFTNYSNSKSAIEEFKRRDAHNYTHQIHHRILIGENIIIIEFLHGWFKRVLRREWADAIILVENADSAQDSDEVLPCGTKFIVHNSESSIQLAILSHHYCLIDQKVAV